MSFSCRMSSLYGRSHVISGLTLRENKRFFRYSPIGSTSLPSALPCGYAAQWGCLCLSACVEHPNFLILTLVPGSTDGHFQQNSGGTLLVSAAVIRWHSTIRRPVWFITILSDPAEQVA